jgi:hypothetical protein
MVNKIRLYRTNYTNQDRPPTLRRTSHTTTSLIAVGYSTSQLKTGDFFCITLHISQFPVRGKPRHWMGIKLTELVSSFRGGSFLHPARHRIYWCWTQSQWIPPLSTTGGEGVAEKTRATIDENPCWLSVISSLDRSTICHYLSQQGRYSVDSAKPRAGPKTSSRWKGIHLIVNFHSFPVRVGTLTPFLYPQGQGRICCWSDRFSMYAGRQLPECLERSNTPNSPFCDDQSI